MLKKQSVSQLLFNKSMVTPQGDMYEGRHNIPIWNKMLQKDQC